MRVGLAAYVFGVIFVAELPDKTSLATLALATRHRALAVFLGAALALALQSLFAVTAGSFLSLLPARPVHVCAGLVFLVSAVVMWIRKDADAEKATAPPSSGPSLWRSMATVFGIVFLAEWGDLTQIATAALAAREKAPLTVFCAATLALWAAAGIAVVIGNRAAKVLDAKAVKRAAAAVFAGVGVALLAGWL